MIAVVYSGSKSSFWRIALDGKVMAECTIPGINPRLNDSKYIIQQLNKNIALINYAEQVKKMKVFAAGASSKESQEALATTLNLFFKNAKIKVKDDIYGASIAACYDKSGIVGILGSGANCAYFNGKKPEKNNFGLGYILGDEGSSNYFGKMILKNFLEDKLPAELKKAFDHKYNLDRATILERIYKKHGAQQYLTSFLDFYLENRNHKFIQQIVDNAFEKYFSTYLLPTLSKHPSQEIHFVGAVAGNFQENLRAIAAKHQLEIMTITKEPIYNLLNYYSN
ncbi:MAG: hypothetical protein EOO87_11385 [Pedobacter sp.]|nr:MAG: hypothetical protein EOO87_11385 [Pedobacter sp.]